MSQKVMVALIGEQPIPNLLPIRYEKPDRVFLIYTDRTETGFERLRDLLKDIHVESLRIKSPYDIFSIQQELRASINDAGLEISNIVFNITGGTKPMAFASYRLAEELSCPFLYLQSEGGKSLIYRYVFSKGMAQLVMKDEIPNVLTIDDYLKAYLGSYKEATAKEKFELLVKDALGNYVNETASSITHGALEIDLVIRCGNQIGIAEIKTGNKARKKEGIDQLNTAGGQRYLGTYTRKFLIVDREIGSQNRALAEAHRIKIIELCSGKGGILSSNDKDKLIRTIRKDLGAQ